jgi:hypothetical protein
MHDKPIHRILNELADEAVPAETDLWPALRAQLDAAGGRRGVTQAPLWGQLNAPTLNASARGAHSKGTLTMTPTLIRPARLRWLAISTLAVLALAAGLLATPQGRVLAQTVWQFFNPAAADSFAVPEAAGAAEPSTGPTAMPPQFAAATCGADLACQLAAAEAAVGFEALLVPAGVAELTWHYVEAFPESGTLRVGYVAEGGGGLVLSQSRGDLPTSPWEAVPPEAAKAVQVNGEPAEYVEGTFVVLPGATEATWNADAPVQRLRWREGDVLYEFTKMGDPQPLEYLDEAGLIALAESLR